MICEAHWERAKKEVPVSEEALRHGHHWCEDCFKGLDLQPAKPAVVIPKSPRVSSRLRPPDRTGHGTSEYAQAVYALQAGAEQAVIHCGNRQAGVAAMRRMHTYASRGGLRITQERVGDNQVVVRLKAAY